MVAEGAANNLQVFILIFAFMIDSKLLLLSLGMLFIDRGFSPVQKVMSTITLRHYKEKLKKHQLTNYWETKVFIVLLYYPYLV